MAEQIKDGHGNDYYLKVNSNGSLNISDLGSLSEFKTQAIDDYTTTNITYFCKLKNDSTWLFVKFDETGSYLVITYANVSNNPTMTTYSLAYASRTSLTYGLIDTLIIN